MMMYSFNFTPDQVDPFVYCAVCTGNTFNTGKHCLPCPDGCEGCSFDSFLMWNTISPFWTEAIANVTDYALSNPISISMIPSFDSSITEASAQNLWM